MTGSRRTGRVVGLALTLGALGVPAAGGAQTPDEDRAAIRDVVMGAYVEGMHGNGDRAVIRAGFHPDFVMKVLEADGGMRDVRIEDWIAGLPPEGQAPRVKSHGEVPTVLLAGDVAVAEVVVSREGRQIFTDYISLYRFPEGWRMVAKVFYAHPRG